MKRTFFFSLFLLFPLLASAASPLALPTQFPSQGDTLIARFAGTLSQIRSAAFGGVPVHFFSYHSALRATIPLSATKTPGKYYLRIHLVGGGEILRTIAVRTRAFPQVTFGVPKKSDLSSLALAETLTQKKTGLLEAVASSTPQVFFSSPFQFPLADHSEITSPFGEVRDSDGVLIRHLGTDFHAPAGFLVYPINNGIVRKAYTDSLYGKSVIVDHGAGIFSLYMHLGDFFVHPGQAITKESPLGTVGDTGEYSSGAHLHLSLKIDGQSVDPVRFISQFK